MFSACFCSSLCGLTVAMGIKGLMNFLRDNAPKSVKEVRIGSQPEKQKQIRLPRLIHQKVNESEIWMDEQIDIVKTLYTIRNRFVDTARTDPSRMLCWEARPRCSHVFTLVVTFMYMIQYVGESFYKIWWRRIRKQLMHVRLCLVLEKVSNRLKTLKKRSKRSTACGSEIASANTQIYGTRFETFRWNSEISLRSAECCLLQRFRTTLT